MPNRIDGALFLTCAMEVPVSRPGALGMAWGCCMRAGQETAAGNAGVRSAHSQSTGPAFSSFNASRINEISVHLNAVELRGSEGMRDFDFTQGELPCRQTCSNERWQFPVFHPMSIKFRNLQARQCDRIGSVLSLYVKRILSHTLTSGSGEIHGA